jgi:5'-nucleotidase (lipoprotein e(P4) family)
MKPLPRLAPIVLLLLLIPLACKKSPPLADKALLWFQQSAECRALFLQTYALAGERLERIATESDSLTSAIIIDIDETVLDNSPQQAGIELGRHPDPRQSWDEWCQAALASPLPGALDFLTRADRLGFAIFYLSNRAKKHAEATRKNLQKWGFPQTSPDRILLRGEESSKEDRRLLVAQSHRIVMLLGDNLGDLCADFETEFPENRSAQVDRHVSDFGSRFVVFPNPMYGSWQKNAAPLKIWPASGGENPN